MFWLRTLQLGIKSLLLHPLRSSLTVLGIFIGVASVIWLLAIGEGIGRKAQEQIADLGATNIIVRTIKPPETGRATGFRLPYYGIKRSDYDVLRQTIPNVDRIVRIREVKPQRAVHAGYEVKDARLVGCTPEYAEIMRLEPAQGHFLSPPELDEGDNVCVLSFEVAQRLFPIEDPIGKLVHFPEQETAYAVVGVMQPREAMAAVGGSLDAQRFDRDVYIPLTTFWENIGDTIITRTSGTFSGERIEINQLTIQVSDIKHVLRTASLVEATLRDRHKQLDFALIVPKELLEQAETTRLMFVAFMGLIAAISLLVGGIGIMNIMLATVTERTREIGIRRAIGAKQRDIVRQFLVETVVLSVVGGVFGILVGLLCPLVVEWLRQAMLHYAPDTMAQLPDVVQSVTPVIVPLSIPLAFFISVAVGVVFGLYPAIRAAKMDPIEALRHE